MGDAVLILFAVAWGWLVWLIAHEKTPRFSLRTLLIAMTLVAVGLGLVVYAIRN